MNLFKKILLAFLIVFIGIQFIQPEHNKNEQELPTDITRVIPVQQNVVAILKNACNDCHSNNTRYPWYVNIQPMGWIMANHIKNGKDDLNFSEFGKYSTRKQENKLKSIASQVKDGSMPISSYTIMHTDARLSEEDKNAVIDWALKTKDSLTAKN